MESQRCPNDHNMGKLSNKHIIHLFHDYIKNEKLYPKKEFCYSGNNNLEKSKIKNGLKLRLTLICLRRSA